MHGRNSQILKSYEKMFDNSQAAFPIINSSCDQTEESLKSLRKKKLQK